MAQDLDTQVNVKMPKRLLTTLREIESRHGISPADALRRLGEEMAKYYATHGWFAFPVKIEPLLHQHVPGTVPQSPAARILAGIKERLLPVPENLNVWSLDSDKDYVIDDDKTVSKLLDQLGLPNLFAHAAEHDQVRISSAFDNHPTHWLMFDLYKGSDRADGNGLMFRAESKRSFSREEMLTKLQREAMEMGSKDTVKFGQIPPRRTSGSSAKKQATSV